MAVLSKKYRCIAIDIKGFGQSSKHQGDFTWEGVSEQFRALLDVLGLDRVSIISHDRGSVLGDYFAGNHPDRVIRYARGEQHLYHYHPMLSPQHALFAQVAELADPRTRVCKSYGWAGRYPIPDEHYVRAIQEFAFPLTAQAVSRYFNSSTFRMEWIDRRTRLLDAWNFPVMILEGKYSTTQPREFYVDSADYLPNCDPVIVEIIDGGHFWPLENVKDTIAAYGRFFDVPVT
jgi:pimeloyl-ACP methyl ester carboxylesterase